MQQKAPKKICPSRRRGIRGLISVEILAKLEAELRAVRRMASWCWRTSSIFVCGTSTGALIAACISAACRWTRSDLLRRQRQGDVRQGLDPSPPALPRTTRSRWRRIRSEPDLALKHRATANEPNATLGSAGLRNC